jgi:putative acetyltransferase
MNMDIRLVDARDPAVVSLIQEADEYASSLYPPESNHLESIAALEKSNVAFFGAYVDEELAACGAVKILEEDSPYGEVKRVFVLEQHRGGALAKAIMGRIECHLTARREGSCTTANGRMAAV